MTDYDWPEIEARRESDETWPEIAADYDVTPGTIRKAYSRWRGNAADAPDTPDISQVHHAPKTDGMKILGIDIETAPNEAFTWGIWKQDIRLDQLIQSSRVLCFSARWFSDGDEAETFFISEHDHGHYPMVLAAWALLDEADAIVHYNGSKFDLPTLNREFIKYDMNPPATYEEVDLLKTARKRFRFQSNKLDHLLKELNLGEKVRHPGFRMWVRCMNDDEDAWEKMEEYNRADVDQMERLYRRMLPWISNHPNHALYMVTEDRTCTNCGSGRLHKRGKYRTRTQVYQRYCCADCGTWQRERYTEVEKDKRHHILRQTT